MTYRVFITAAAKRNMRDAHASLVRHAPETVDDWLNRFEAAINTLADFPRRCALAREDRLVDDEIREMIFGKRRGAFRVLFTITDDEVRVLHVRRASRQWATKDDLSQG